MDTSNLLKYRSVTACMKASYDLLSNNIKSFLKKTWVAFLVFAIFMSLFMFFRMPNLALHNWGEANPWSSFLIQTFVYLACIVSDFIAASVFWSWLNKKGVMSNLANVFFTGILFGLIVVVLCLWAPTFNMGLVAGYAAKAIPAHQSLTTIYVISGIIGIVNIILAFLCIVPFGYIVPKWMLRENGEPIRIWQWYKCGLRHFGALFKAEFLGALILLILYLLISIPCIIIGYVQIESQLGALDGDPLGVPSYFTLLFLVVFIITNFLYFYLGSWFGLTFAYLYGSIEVQEKEKRERLEGMAADSAMVSTIE